MKEVLSKKTGNFGEEIAATFLKEHGYKIIARNYRNRFGEIDIIAREKGILCFVEVKTRRNSAFGSPFEAIGEFKKKRMITSTKLYLEEIKMNDVQVRFDAVFITLDEDGTWQKSLIKGSFEA
ncbi:MAG: YraN family protein [Candidatus Omnitrophica bacterium]|nr:YraN family protein [Candidatus Omnitrophota bacterium]